MSHADRYITHAWNDRGGGFIESTSTDFVRCPNMNSALNNYKDSVPLSGLTATIMTDETNGLMLMRLDGSCRTVKPSNDGAYMWLSVFTPPIPQWWAIQPDGEVLDTTGYPSGSNTTAEYRIGTRAARTSKTTYYEPLGTPGVSIEVDPAYAAENTAPAVFAYHLGTIGDYSHRVKLTIARMDSDKDEGSASYGMKHNLSYIDWTFDGFTLMFVRCPSDV